MKNKGNYAFIDSQNLYVSIQRLGWKLDFARFRVYLNDKYGVTKAYIFIGYLPENKPLYWTLEKAGYELIFKPIVRTNSRIKGNCDTELVLQAMIDIKQYHKAILVSGDGDFFCLIKYLLTQDKFERLIIPDKYRYSSLLRNGVIPKRQISFMTDLRKMVESTKHRP